MSNPSVLQLKERFGESTIKLIVLGIFSFGIYYFIWLAERSRDLNRLSKGKVVDNVYLIVGAIACGTSSVFVLITTALGIDVFDPFSIVYGIVFVVIAFRVANFFELYIAKVYKINVRFNRFFLIIFHINYVNYKINDLPNIVRKEEYLDVKNDGFCSFKCSKCGFQKRLPSKYFGKTAKCPKCNESNQIS